MMSENQKPKPSRFGKPSKTPNKVKPLPHFNKKFRPKDVVRPDSWDALMLEHKSRRDIAKFLAAWGIVAIAAMSLRHELFYMGLFAFSTIMGLITGFILPAIDGSPNKWIQDWAGLIVGLFGIFIPGWVYLGIVAMAIYQFIPISGFLSVVVIMVIWLFSFVMGIHAMLGMCFLGQALFALLTHQTTHLNRKKRDG